ncbi:MAG: protein-disulfide reductase DsbD family protein [Planctomycetota bacterium]
MMRIGLSLSLLWLIGLAPLATAQPRPKASAKLFTRIEDDVVRAAIQIRVDPGFHLYHDDLGHPDAIGKPTSIRFEGEGVEWSKPVFPEPHRFDQSDIAPNDAFILGHEGTLVVHAIGRVKTKGAASGIRVTIDGLTCQDDGSCVPYRQKDIASSGTGPDAVFASFPANLKAPGGAKERPKPTQSGRAKTTVYHRVEGNDLRVALEIAIDKGFHLYHVDLGHPDAIGQPTTITPGGEGIEWSKPVFPDPKTFDQSDITPGAFILGHEGTILVYLRGTLQDGASAEDLSIDISGLTCEDDGSCVPYSAKHLASSGKGPEAVFAAFPAPEKKTIEQPGPPGAAQQQGEVEATVYSRVDGSVVRVAIELDISEHYHLYHEDLGHPDATGVPTVITLQGKGIEWSDLAYPEPKRFDQSMISPGAFILGHEGTIIVYAAGEIAVGASGEKFWVDIEGLTCEDNGSCIPYSATNLVSAGRGPDAMFEAFPASLSVADSGAAESGAGPQGKKTTEVRPDTTKKPEREWTEAELAEIGFADYELRDDGTADRSLLTWMFFAFLAGIILNVMPCVLPVISLKVISLVSHAGESRGRMFLHGLVYSVGILVIFLILASLAAFAQQGWGEQFQSQTFLVIMIAVVFAFSLSLLGVFELGVPSKVGEVAGVQREGLKDSFIKGIMTTVLATPCSGPFLGATLAWAVTQSPVTIFAVFICVGLGMAAPYLLLVSHPAFLKFVPKPGAWMETFKQVMGFLLMGTVIYLMISLNQNRLLFTIAFLIFVGIGCWVWGHFARPEQPRSRHLATFVIALLVVAAGGHVSFRWFPGLLGMGEAAAATEGLTARAKNELWQPFDPEKLAAYHQQGRNVLVDFTADWCPNCKLNEHFVYYTDEVSEVLLRKNVACLIADKTSDEDPMTAKIGELQAKLGSYSIPFMAIFPGDDPLQPYTFRDIVSRDDLIEALESLPDPKVSER